MIERFIAVPQAAWTDHPYYSIVDTENAVEVATSKQDYYKTVVDSLNFAFVLVETHELISFQEEETDKKAATQDWLNELRKLRDELNETLEGYNQ